MVHVPVWFPVLRPTDGPADETRRVGESGIAGLGFLERDLDSAGTESRRACTAEELQEAAVVALVSDWSWDLPITRESLDELPSDDADELVAHCENLVSDMFADTSPSPDEDSPTTPLSD